jgi:small conductance mechanosensitive channel
MSNSLLPSQPECAADAGSWCAQIYRLTDSDFLARSADTIFAAGSRILFILVLALIVRWFLHRLINRIVAGATSNPVTKLMNRGAAAAAADRSSQRARTLGSVLRSLCTAVVGVTAMIMVLSEFGVDLAPILASAGIVGIAVGFGAQNLVKDFIAGLFMLLEDQYGIGDVVDIGETVGTVEAVGLRITTIRDASGVVWYVRNGEIVRVGNKSQGWAVVNIDVPVGFVAVDQATAVLREAAAAVADDPDFVDDFIDPPTVLGVEQLTVEGAVLRTTVKTSTEAQWRVGRELRRRLTEALEKAGIAAQITASRMFIRPPADGNGGTDTGQAGPT